MVLSHALNFCNNTKHWLQNSNTIYAIKCNHNGKVSNTYVHNTYGLKNMVRQRGWMATDGRWWTNVCGCNYDGQQTKWQWMVNKTERNGTRLRQTTPTTASMTMLHNGLCPWALQRWYAKKIKIKKINDSLLFLLILLLLFLELLHGLFTTWLQVQKPDVNLKTHVWGKQVYVGCITWCRSCIAIKPCVCVCVCACSQYLKLVVKQALELLTPSTL